MTPRIAIVPGDPAGIGPELVAKLLAAPDAARPAEILLVADRETIESGLQAAGCRFDYQAIAALSGLGAPQAGAIHLYDPWGTAQGPFVRSQASTAGGRYSLDTLQVALAAAQDGQVDAILYGPLNKTSLHLAGMAHSDELHWFAEQLGHTGPCCEFNVLGDLWTSRVTSHVAIRDVPALITPQRVLDAIRLIHMALRHNGVAEPRIAVCGLNPHNGDNGNFGREEIEVIGPAVQQAQDGCLLAEGPFPADTIFLKVQDEQRAYDAIVTMYHDQGQIALKLMGFWRGVTVAGGLSVPITTPAHGTAFDIAGQGKAHPGAMRQAFAIACRMGAARRAAAR